MPEKVSLDNLASAIMDALKEYGAHSDVVVEAAVNAAGKDCVAEIRANAPERPNGGRYKRSWRGKAETPAPHRYTYTARTGTASRICSKTDTSTGTAPGRVLFRTYARPKRRPRRS